MPGGTVRNRFTLVELLVVMAIISVLAGMLLPALEKARDSAHAIACASQLKQIGLGIQVYMSDYDDWTPAVIQSGGTTGLNWYLCDPNLPTWSYIYLSQAKGKSATDRSAKLFLCPAAPPVSSGPALQYNHNLGYVVEVGGADLGVGGTLDDNGYVRRKGSTIASPSLAYTFTDIMTDKWTDGRKMSVMEFFSRDPNTDNLEFRHQGACNMLLFDAHVSRQLPGNLVFSTTDALNWRKYWPRIF